MRARTLPALLLTSLLAAAGEAHADRAAAIAQGGDSHFTAAVRDGAIGAVADALREDGLQVLSAREVARRMAGPRCTGQDCAERARQQLGVDVLATVALWAAGADRSVPANVLVSLVVAGAPPYRGQAEVQGHELRAALIVALAMARSRQAMGPGPWLRVNGEPRGAVVVVDGTDRGVLPYEGHIDPGTHAVRVRLTGYATQDHRVAIPATAEDPVVLEVHLAPSPPPPVSPPLHARPDTPPTRVEPQADRPIIGPLVLGVVGLAAMGVAAFGILAPERCDRTAESGRCLVVSGQPDPTVIAAYGAAGLVAIVGAALWHLLLGSQVSETVTTTGRSPGESTEVLR